jgi:hypothetical protein
MQPKFLILWASMLFLSKMPAQKAATQPKLVSLEWADSLHRPRLWAAGAVLGTVYPTSMVMLWNTWYEDYPIQRFHLFNDMGEWNQMDKVGHFFSAYQEQRLGYHFGRWAGMGNRGATWAGFGLAQLVQTSFEVFDGFSADWGFSLGDVGFNLGGSALFTAQQLTWREQRIGIKVSTRKPNYPDVTISPALGNGPPVTLQQRADALYGTGLTSLLLKDYNAQTIWATVNPRSFAPDARWLPRWLNVAVGKGADNMFAGFGYAWRGDKNCTGPDCPIYVVDPVLFPRTRQYYLSLDVDLTRIPVKNRTLRTVLAAFNVFKVPAPTLEWSRQRGMRFAGIR